MSVDYTKLATGSNLLENCLSTKLNNMMQVSIKRDLNHLSCYLLEIENSGKVNP